MKVKNTIKKALSIVCSLSLIAGITLTSVTPAVADSSRDGTESEAYIVSKDSMADANKNLSDLEGAVKNDNGWSIVYEEFNDTEKTNEINEICR